MDDKVYITLEQLIDLKVCVGVRDDFEALFPEGRVEVTYENAEKYKCEFPFYAAAKLFLDYTHLREWEDEVGSVYEPPHDDTPTRSECNACMTRSKTEAKMFVKYYRQQVLGENSD